MIPTLGMGGGAPTIDLPLGMVRQAHHRIRTDDPFLTMEVLYQLS
jgi:hypothetical protein